MTPFFWKCWRNNKGCTNRTPPVGRTQAWQGVGLASFFSFFLGQWGYSRKSEISQRTTPRYLSLKCECGSRGPGGKGRHDEHRPVARELPVRLLAERDGGAHLRLLHHHRLQRQERPSAAARLADHAKKCRRLHGP